ncbi:hypothetical protein PCC6912_05030 [Chlorogloeopsis fritschii PCC 6912]|uniref:Uncharacterized protein n=1 Tax=Chlorogloeopsis fritschii PCC 6912 TaxID=211165 RepID=A0A3S0Y379_CHLFR|nr:hypothetical protein PCC6912_05030 [Chlorogloeopsis fritschii PCC 6912]
MRSQNTLDFELFDYLPELVTSFTGTLLHEFFIITSSSASPTASLISNQPKDKLLSIFTTN